jgi:hypothetical protein
MQSIPLDPTQHPVLLFAALIVSLVALISTRALPTKIRTAYRPSIHWMNAVTLAIIAIIYALAYSKINLCEYQHSFLKAAVGGALVALLTFVAHLLLRKKQAARNIPSTAILLSFFVLRVGVISALIAAVGYLQLSTYIEDTYRAFGIKLQVEQGGILVNAPSLVRLQSNQPLTVVGEVRECKNTSVKWTHEPKLGRFNTTEQGIAVYIAPDTIKETTGLALQAESPLHLDAAKIQVQLLRTPNTVSRYSSTDPKYPDTLYDFIVLSNTESWLFGDFANIAPNSTKNRDAIDACRVIKQLQTDALLENYQAVIAIGTASRQGSDAEERIRAKERATKLATCIGDSLWKLNSKRMPKIYTLNLGRFQSSAKSSPESTAQERRAIVMGLISGKRTESEVLRDFDISVIGGTSGDPFIRALSENYVAQKLEAWPGRAQ